MSQATKIVLASLLVFGLLAVALVVNAALA
jgi:hypothetical protein